MQIDYNKNWPPYSWMYNLHNSLQFEIILTSNTENHEFKHSDYKSIYIAVLLTVNAFDCDVTGVPCEGTVCECDNYWIFILYCSNEQNIQGYTSMKLKTMFFDLIFFVLFTSFYKTIKNLNSHKRYSKISHFFPIAHVKIGYTFRGPCLHGLGSSKTRPYP